MNVKVFNLPVRGYKIIGGNEVSNNKYPWFARITIHTPNNESICGGSLISNKFILTAAQCVSGIIDNDTIKNGCSITININNLTRSGTKLFINKNYDSTKINNDIAIIELDTPVTDIEPIKLNYQTVRSNAINNVNQDGKDVQLGLLIGSTLLAAAVIGFFVALALKVIPNDLSALTYMIIFSVCILTPVIYSFTYYNEYYDENELYKKYKLFSKTNRDTLIGLRGLLVVPLLLILYTSYKVLTRYRYMSTSNQSNQGGIELATV